MDVQQSPLMPFDGSCHTSIDTAIPFTLQDYLQLVDETGSAIRQDKKGFLKQSTPSILDQLGVEAESWITCIRCYGRMFSVIAGSRESMRAQQVDENKKWFKGGAAALVVVKV